MGFRTVQEIAAKDGSGELCAWISKYMDGKERGLFEARLVRLENDEAINPKWFKRYKAIKGWEIVFDTGGKAYRFLSDQTGTRITVLVPCKKKGSITEAEEAQAIALIPQLQKGSLRVRDYPLPTRA